MPATTLLRILSLSSKHFCLQKTRENTANCLPASLCSNRTAATLAKMRAHLMRKLGQSVLWRERSHKSPGLSGLNLWGGKCSEILKIFPLSNPWGGDTAFLGLQKVFNFISPSLVLHARQTLNGLNGGTLATCLMSAAFHTNEVQVSGVHKSTFHTWPCPELPLRQCFPIPGFPGLGPRQHSEHHYSRILYLEMGSINPCRSDWTLVSSGLLFFLLSIHKNTYLLEHVDALCNALPNVH